MLSASSIELTALFNTFYIFSADFCVKLSGENASVESLWAS